MIHSCNIFLLLLCPQAWNHTTFPQGHIVICIHKVYKMREGYKSVSVGYWICVCPAWILFMFDFQPRNALGNVDNCMVVQLAIVKL